MITNTEKTIESNVSNWVLKAEFTHKPIVEVSILSFINSLDSVNVFIERQTMKRNELVDEVSENYSLLTHEESKSLRDWFIEQYPLSRDELKELMRQADMPVITFGFEEIKDA